MAFNYYDKEVEQTEKEMRETWEQIPQARSDERHYQRPVKFGTWKDKNGHERQLFVYDTINEQTKMFEIAPDADMLDDVHTFDTFRANNLHLAVFGIYNRKASELEHKYKSLQVALEAYKRLQKNAYAEADRDANRAKEIHEKLTERERLQEELEEFRKKYQD